MPKKHKTQIKASVHRTQADVLKEYKKKHPNEVVDSIHRIRIIYLINSHDRKRRK